MNWSKPGYILVFGPWATATHILFGRAALPFYQTSIFVEAGIRLFQQSIDNIDDARPVDINIVGIFQIRSLQISALARGTKQRCG